MRKTLVLVASVVTLLIAGAAGRQMSKLPQSTPKKPLWPIAFQGAFGLNDHLFDYYNKSSMFYYNWTHANSSRISYPNGCLPLITKKPCDLIFDATDCYMLAPKDGKPCCRLFKVGSLPPDFLRGFSYDDTDTAKDMFGNEHTTLHWTGFPDFGYWTDKTTGEDIQFKDSFTGTYWNWGPLEVPNHIDSSLFDIPSQCSDSCIFDHDDEETKQRLRKLTPDMLGPYFRRPEGGF